jgi:O-methyltransferase involved in polyketide biosynthesis
VPTLWVAEGLLFSLEEDVARSLPATVAGLGADGSVLAGDLLSQQSMVSEFTQAGMERLRGGGSPPWRFGTDEPEELLAGCGRRVADLRTPGEDGAAFGRRPWPPLPRDVTGFPRDFLVTATRA